MLLTSHLTGLCMKVSCLFVAHIGDEQYIKTDGCKFKMKVEHVVKTSHVQTCNHADATAKSNADCTGCCCCLE